MTLSLANRCSSSDSEQPPSHQHIADVSRLYLKQFKPFDTTQEAVHHMTHRQIWVRYGYSNHPSREQTLIGGGRVRNAQKMCRNDNTRSSLGYSSVSSRWSTTQRNRPVLTSTSGGQKDINKARYIIGKKISSTDKKQKYRVGIRILWNQEWVKSKCTEFQRLK